MIASSIVPTSFETDINNTKNCFGKKEEEKQE
jgi:hypothetical protein